MNCSIKSISSSVYLTFQEARKICTQMPHQAKVAIIIHAFLSIVVREFGSKWLSSQNKQPAPAVVLKHGIDTESASPQGCLEESSPRKKNIFIFKF